MKFWAVIADVPDTSLRQIEQSIGVFSPRKIMSNLWIIESKDRIKIFDTIRPYVKDDGDVMVIRIGAEWSFTSRRTLGHDGVRWLADNHKRISSSVFEKLFS